MFLSLIIKSNHYLLLQDNWLLFNLYIGTYILIYLYLYFTYRYPLYLYRYDLLYLRHNLNSRY